MSDFDSKKYLSNIHRAMLVQKKL